MTVAQLIDHGHAKVGMFRVCTAWCMLVCSVGQWVYASHEHFRILACAGGLVDMDLCMCDYFQMLVARQ